MNTNLILYFCQLIWTDMFVSGTVMVIISKTVPDTPRINVTPASAAHAELLKYWSVLTGRSASSLCSSLLAKQQRKKATSSPLILMHNSDT